MITRLSRPAGVAIAGVVIASTVAFSSGFSASALPDVATARQAGAAASPSPVATNTSDRGATSAAALDTAVFAGGCFWGVQAVFQHVKGVIAATSGYSGGAVVNPSYARVSDGDTGHAEAVRVVFDPAVVSYERLMQVFFDVAHDPTELNRQGPDVGTQYRSAIFYRTPAQLAATQAYVGTLGKSGKYKSPVVTQVAPLAAFYVAEKYHQDYATLHPNDMYIRFNDAPKVEALKERYPALWSERLAAH